VQKPKAFGVASHSSRNQKSVAPVYKGTPRVCTTAQVCTAHRVSITNALQILTSTGVALTVELCPSLQVVSVSSRINSEIGAKESVRPAAYNPPWLYTTFRNRSHGECSKNLKDLNIPRINSEIGAKKGVGPAAYARTQV